MKNGGLGNQGIRKLGRKRLHDLFHAHATFFAGNYMVQLNKMDIEEVRAKTAKDEFVLSYATRIKVSS